MVMNHSLETRETALEWLVRTNDPRFEEWDEFTMWLEEDAANAAAYHTLAASEVAMLPLIATASPRPKASRPRFARLAVGSAAAAAAATVLLVVTPHLMPAEYHTRAGEIRTVWLGGRDRMVMNGDTTLAVSGWSHRTVRLQQGQILVELPEPGPSKVSVVSGDLKLVDVGTVFEVARDGRDTRLLVSDGAVVADPDGARLEVDAGERLDTADGAEVLQATATEVSSVGSFQRGQLTYVDEPLAHVLADLRRSTGLDISAAEAIKAHRFTGTLSVTQVKRNPRSLGALLGLSIEQSGRGWKLLGRV
jgi:transmembrane sensor